MADWGGMWTQKASNWIPLVEYSQQWKSKQRKIKPSSKNMMVHHISSLWFLLLNSLSNLIETHYLIETHLTCQQCDKRSTESLERGENSSRWASLILFSL